MDEISIISKSSLLGKEIDVYGTIEEPLFKAQDVVKWLDLSNTRDVVKRIDADEVRKLNLRSRQGETWFLTEDGVYEVLMQSRKPIAKQFKKGVKKILKEIRMKGGYIATQQNDTPEMIMARALQVADETIKRHEQQMRLLEYKNEEQAFTIQKQKDEMAKAMPKLNYYRDTLRSESLLTTTQITNDLGISARTLNKRLKDIGIIYFRSGQWILKGKFKGLSLHGSKTYLYKNKVGKVCTKISTLWTERGRRLIVALYHNDFDIEGAIQEMSGKQEILYPHF